MQIFIFLDWFSVLIWIWTPFTTVQLGIIPTHFILG